MAKVLLSLCSISLMVLHIAFPALAIDSIAVVLLVVAAIPWLGSLFKSIELPGGVRVEYKDFKEIEQRMRQDGLLPIEPEHPKEPLYVRISEEDPNLALAALRIEIERELVALAERKALIVDGKSLKNLALALAKEKFISANAYLAISDLAHLLNNAVHGATVERTSLEWALSVGPQILGAIRKIN